MMTVLDYKEYCKKVSSNGLDGQRSFVTDLSSLSCSKIICPLHQFNCGVLLYARCAWIHPSQASVVHKNLCSLVHMNSRWTFLIGEAAPGGALEQIESGCLAVVRQIV